MSSDDATSNVGMPQSRKYAHAVYQFILTLVAVYVGNFLTMMIAFGWAGALESGVVTSAFSSVGIAAVASPVTAILVFGLWRWLSHE